MSLCETLCYSVLARRSVRDCIPDGGIAMAQVSAAVIDGTCDPRFELVRQEFERNFSQRGEVGASVSVTIEGSSVVDLWGGLSDPETGRLWERDTTVVVWSCTKGATAICAHILV